jgi:hypothetical protein
MALNLLRNSRLFFTTSVDATTGKIAGSGSTTDTFEIQVLDGFSFSQNTNSETVTINEAGSSPVRGQRSFNTSLAPVDFSFSTYIRPKLVTNEVKCEESVLWNALLGIEATTTTPGTITVVTPAAPTYVNTTGILTIPGTTIAVTGGASPTFAKGDYVIVTGISSTVADDAELVNQPGLVTNITAAAITIQLLNPSSSAVAGTLSYTASSLKLYKSAWAPVVLGAANATPQAFSLASTHTSNDNQLVKFGLLVVVDNVTYAIDNCALNQASIDFGLDGIATVQWTGQATVMRQLATSITTPTAGTFTGASFTGGYTQKVTDAAYITNKLSTVTLKTVKALLDGAGSSKAVAGTEYYVALTGGNVTINNNISYITPMVLGVVNQPVAYYTGTRAISGNLTAYLNTGTLTGTVTKGTGALLQDMLDSATGTIEPMFSLVLDIGGSANKLRVEMEMPSTSIAIPAIGTDQVVTTTINFTAQPTAGNATGSNKVYDVTGTNELFVRYFHS